MATAYNSRYIKNYLGDYYSLKTTYVFSAIDVKPCKMLNCIHMIYVILHVSKSVSIVGKESIMERIITGVVDFDGREVTLNGIVMSLDKYDAFSIDVEELFIVDDPIAYGEKEIANLLTEEEQILFYNIMGNSKVMTLTAMANVLKKNTGFIKELFTLALSRGILMVGWNSTYKVVSKNMRERMIAKAAKLTEAKANTKSKISTKELIKQSSDMNVSTNLQELYSEEEENTRTEELEKVLPRVSRVKIEPQKLPSKKSSMKLPVKKK